MKRGCFLSGIGIFLAGAICIAIAPYSAHAEIVIPDVEIISLEGDAVGYSSPAVADVDNNLENGLEIALAGADGLLYLFSADGTLRWSAKLPNFSCTATSSRDKVFSSPAIGKLFGDGVSYVVVGYGGFGGDSCPGGLAAFNALDGTRRWNFDTKKYGKKQKYFVFKRSIFSTPALADVDGDGKLEIGFGGFDRNVYLLEANGKVRWYYHAADTVWSSPAFANIDKDAQLEMVIGTDISRNDFIRPPTSNGGYVLAFETHKHPEKKIGFRDTSTGHLKWIRTMEQVIFSSPVAAEVFPTKRGLEIVVGTGCYFPENSTSKVGRSFRILSSSGNILRKLSTTICSPSSPAVVDVTGDELPEVVISVSGESQWGGDGTSRIMTYDPIGGSLLWEREISAIFPFQSPLVADMDLDGVKEVIAPSAAHVTIIHGSTGEQLNRVRLPGQVQSTPAIADIDNDGLLDMVVGGLRGANGALFIWRGFTSDIEEFQQVPLSAASLPWGQWRGGAGRQGLVD